MLQSAFGLVQIRFRERVNVIRITAHKLGASPGHGHIEKARKAVRESSWGLSHANGTTCGRKTQVKDWGWANDAAGLLKSHCEENVCRWWSELDGGRVSFFLEKSISTKFRPESTRPTPPPREQGRNMAQWGILTGDGIMIRDDVAKKRD